MLRPTEDIERDLVRLRNFVAARVPVYARLLDALQPQLRSGFRERLDQAWHARTFNVWYERPLLLMAALRTAAFELGDGHPLARALADTAPEPDALTAQALAEAIAPDSLLFWRTVAERAVQTNELSRAVAWLWPALILQQRLPGAVVDLHDVGASAGLNLVADRVPWTWRDEAGSALVTSAPHVGQRVGYDLSPLDPSQPSARSWLRACTWPGQTERFERLRAAFEAYDDLVRMGGAPRLHAAAASDIPGLLPVPERAAIAYQTVMRDYLSPAESEVYEAGMHDWLRKKPGQLLWVELEPIRTEEAAERSTSLTAHVATRAGAIIDVELARCHPHPSVLSVARGSVAELAKRLS